MASSQSKQAPRVPYITLEEHWCSPASAATMGDDDLLAQGFPQRKVTELRDVSADGPRLTQMNANSIALQIVSHAPVHVHHPTSASQVNPTDECRASNDELAERIRGNEDLRARLRGFARLPMHDPAAAAAELRRSVADLGFVGCLVDNSLPVPSTATDSVFYDHRSYDAVWQACSDLDVPFYLHPSYPPTGEATPQYRFEPAEGGSFGAPASLALSAFGFGWHADAALHFLRLVAAGIFDRFPALRFVLGHYGEGLPFFLERAGPILALTAPDLRRGLAQVWEENVWITTSGFWGQAPVAAALRVTRPERIMFSVDWPFSYNEKGVEYMQWLWESGLVTAEQWEGIAFRNCLDLFGWSEEVLVRD